MNSRAGKCDTINNFLQFLKYQARQPIIAEPMGKKTLIMVTASGLFLIFTNSIAKNVNNYINNDYKVCLAYNKMERTIVSPA